MSAKYNKVKDYYDGNFWSRQMVRNAVVRGWITAEEYTMITGEAYD